MFKPCLEQKDKLCLKRIILKIFKRKKNDAKKWGYVGNSTEANILPVELELKPKRVNPSKLKANKHFT